MSSYEYEEYYLPQLPPLGLISVWFGVLLIGITAIAHLLTGPSALFWTNPFMYALQLALVALIMGSLIYLLLGINDNVKLAAVPLVINVGTLLIVRFVPFSSLWQEMRFQLHQTEYDEVVRLVESGAIQPDAFGYAELPFSYRALTRDGSTIRIDRSEGVTRIFFYTSRHTSQNFTGYFYRSDNNPPQPGEFDGRWRFVDQERPYWFFCSSYYFDTI